MTIFEAGPGFSVNGNVVDLDVSQLPEAAVLDLLAEAQAVAEQRGLTVPATKAAGELTVSTTELLVATLDKYGAWYTRVATELNKGRSKRNKFEIVPEDELADRAKVSLTAERLRAVEAPSGLYRTAERPVAMMAVPNARLSHKESIQPWASSRGGKIHNWTGLIAFLEQWPADELSGFDPNNAEPVRFVAIETGYDESRRGNRDSQLAGLRLVRQSHPAIHSAAIFEGGVLVHGYSGVGSTNWKDVYTRDIERDPRDDCVPGASVSDDGQASVDASSVGNGSVSRRVVR